jgi:predicted acetyltransferase
VLSSQRLLPGRAVAGPEFPDGSQYLVHVSPAVTLVPALEDDKPVLANLLQLYRYDMSEFRDYELTEHGTFIYRFLDHYWSEPGRQAFLIRHDGCLAGFAMVRDNEHGEREVAEFFVLRSHRRDGVSRQAALLLLRRFPGRWEVFHDDANVRAGRFWAAVVREASGGQFDKNATVSSAGFVGQEYRFGVP